MIRSTSEDDEQLRAVVEEADALLTRLPGAKGEEKQAILARLRELGVGRKADGDIAADP